jgi:glycosyltransferase involved in cell wall biosynthesis
VYNAASFVAEAVESALIQPQTGQVILVEDGSTDPSLSVCQSLASGDERVELWQHPGGVNRGVSASRNLGIAAARCEYTAFLDADDWYLPGRFAPAAKVFASDPTIDGVYDAIGTVYEDEDVAEWCRGRGEPELISLRAPVPPDRLFEALVGAEDKGFFCTDGIAVRTSLIKRVGGFDISLRMGEDTAMWVRLSAMGRLVPGSLREPVGMRRIHAGNTIYSGRGYNPKYAVQMARLLLQWARDVRLPWRRRVLLCDLLLNFRLEEIPDDACYLGRKARELMLFSGFAARHPLALSSPHYWGVVGATVGARRIFPKRVPERSGEAGETAERGIMPPVQGTRL